MAVALILGSAWTVAVALLQQPDEPNHMARIQRITEGGQLKTPVTRDWSTDETLGAGAVNALGLPGFPTIKPAWDPAADAAYREAAKDVTPALRRDADAPTTADGNPPVYYWLGTLPYRLGGDFLTRTWVVRLASVLLFGGTVVAAWLLLGELFGRRRTLQVAGAGFVALQPMAASISSAVSPDGLVILATTLTLWMLVRVVRRPWSWREVAGLLAAFVLAAATKASALALAPAVLVALVVAGLRTPRGRRLVPRTRAGVAGVVGVGAAGFVALFLLLRLAAPTVAPQLAGSLDNLPAPRPFLSYLWQFYLGPADFLVPTVNAGTSARFVPVWVEQGWGRFGPLDSGLPPDWFTVILWGGTLLVLAALAAAVSHRRRIDPAVVAVLGLAGLVTVLGLHLTEYSLLVSFVSGPILQGRYLLPLIGLGAVVVAGALALVPRAWRVPATGALLGVLLAIHLSGLYAAAERYYAS